MSRRLQKLSSSALKLSNIFYKLSDFRQIIKKAYLSINIENTIDLFKKAIFLLEGEDADLSLDLCRVYYYLEQYDLSEDEKDKQGYAGLISDVCKQLRSDLEDGTYEDASNEGITKCLKFIDTYLKESLSKLAAETAKANSDLEVDEDTLYRLQKNIINSNISADVSQLGEDVDEPLGEEEIDSLERQIDELQEADRSEDEAQESEEDRETEIASEFGEGDEEDVPTTHQAKEQAGLGAGGKATKGKPQIIAESIDPTIEGSNAYDLKELMSKGKLSRVQEVYRDALAAYVNFKKDVLLPSIVKYYSFRDRNENELAKSKIEISSEPIEVQRNIEQIRSIYNQYQAEYLQALKKTKLYGDRASAAKCKINPGAKISVPDEVFVTLETGLSNFGEDTKNKIISYLDKIKNLYLNIKRLSLTAIDDSGRMAPIRGSKERKIFKRKAENLFQMIAASSGISDLSEEDFQQIKKDYHDLVNIRSRLNNRDNLGQYILENKDKINTLLIRYGESPLPENIVDSTGKIIDRSYLPVGKTTFIKYDRQLTNVISSINNKYLKALSMPTLAKSLEEALEARKAVFSSGTQYISSKVEKAAKKSTQLRAQTLSSEDPFKQLEGEIHKLYRNLAGSSGSNARNILGVISKNIRLLDDAAIQELLGPAGTDPNIAEIFMKIKDFATAQSIVDFKGPTKPVFSGPSTAKTYSITVALDEIKVSVEHSTIVSAFFKGDTLERLRAKGTFAEAMPLIEAFSIFQKRYRPVINSFNTMFNTKAHATTPRNEKLSFLYDKRDDVMSAAKDFCALTRSELTKNLDLIYSLADKAKATPVEELPQEEGQESKAMEELQSYLSQVDQNDRQKYFEHIINPSARGKFETSPYPSVRDYWKDIFDNVMHGFAFRAFREDPRFQEILQSYNRGSSEE